jgi:hypothetical protein
LSLDDDPYRAMSDLFGASDMALAALLAAPGCPARRKRLRAAGKKSPEN